MKHGMEFNQQGAVMNQIPDSSEQALNDLLVDIQHNSETNLTVNELKFHIAESIVNYRVAYPEDAVRVALGRVYREVKELPQNPYIQGDLDIVFYVRLRESLDKPHVKRALSDYAAHHRYLLSKSDFHTQGIFQTNNSDYIADRYARQLLERRSVSWKEPTTSWHPEWFHLPSGRVSISSKAQVKELVEKELSFIQNDPDRCALLERALGALECSSDIKSYFREHPEYAARLHEPEVFRENVVLAHLKQSERLYDRYMECVNRERSVDIGR